jgi:hypothetical protein
MKSAAEPVATARLFAGRSTRAAAIGFAAARLLDL